ncbi:MAG: septum formation protein Maf [Clostridia bacterium]|nr:septum formation protein Maf [Clostridia bacterium]
MRFVLASASPRRREILTKLGYSFIVISSNAPEDDVQGTISEKVRKLAERKAVSVAAIEKDALIIAADTLVGLDGETLGKPKDKADAVQMLKMLSGRMHEVTTGICLINTLSEQKLVSSETTYVEFREMSKNEIDEYVETGEPMDKAGSYAIQGGAAKFVKKYTGSYDNIVGFPSELFSDMLKKLI